MLDIPQSDMEKLMLEDLRKQLMTQNSIHWTGGPDSHCNDFVMTLTDTL